MLKLIGIGEAEALDAAAVGRDGEGMERADLERICAEAIDFSFPLVETDERRHALELFHGPTLAFKDVALQLVGRMFDHVLAQRNQRVTIVGATSGDTGSAAIDGVAGCESLSPFAPGRPARPRKDLLARCSIVSMVSDW